MNQNTLDLDEGAVTLQYPKAISPESYEDLKDWLDLMARRVQRAVQESSATDSEQAPTTRRGEEGVE